MYGGALNLSLNGTPTNDSQSPIIQFTVDSGPSATVTPSLVPVFRNMLLFQSPQLMTPAPHTLIVNLTRLTTVAPFCLSYLAVQFPTGDTALIPSTSTSPPFSSATTPTTPLPPQAVGNTPTGLAGRIVGAVLGGVGLVALILFACVLWRRRRRSKSLKHATKDRTLDAIHTDRELFMTLPPPRR